MGTIVFGGLYWGPLILENFHVCCYDAFTMAGTLLADPDIFDAVPRHVLE